MVAITFGPVLATEHSSLVLIKRLLLSYLTGFGISTVVAILVFLKTSHSVFLEDSQGFLVLCQDILQKEKDLLEPQGGGGGDQGVLRTQILSNVRETTAKTIGSMSQLSRELSFAKAEIAFGLYKQKDLDDISKCLQALMIPLPGLSKIGQFEELFSEQASKGSLLERLEKITSYSFKSTVRDLEYSVQHASILLGLIDSTQAKTKVTSDISRIERDETVQQHLYIRHLLNSVSRAVQDPVALAELKVADGTTSRRRLIFPWFKILCSLGSSTLNINLLTGSSQNTMDEEVMPFESNFDLLRDPEHLLATNVFETWGNAAWSILQTLSSDSSKFGLRAAAAAMSIGYELQVSVNGVSKATVSGQKYFPPYTVAPYRLLCVVAGLFVAFIWTIFPVQTSEHSILRKTTSMSLSLLARYVGSVSATLDRRIRGFENATDPRPNWVVQLKERRYRVLYQELTLLVEMKLHLAMTSYELSIGEKFLKGSYGQVIDEIQRLALDLTILNMLLTWSFMKQSIVASLSVVAYVPQTFVRAGKAPFNAHVINAYSDSLLHPSSGILMTILSVLAPYIATGTPLPPGLEQQITTDVIKHFLEDLLAEDDGQNFVPNPEVEAFIAAHIATADIVMPLQRLVSTVKELVGELNLAHRICTALGLPSHAA
ncbi:hypothetical protein AOQ84DRAFT_376686 [Glonium stellatum]|uniref:Putative ER transporter 6TM N-terminal domain-containing protein n=1 Tax=Glonium stellatum TaxID=574774 RepID=A0A8E2F0V5_9PEZI|nr:hypothetical protein AOQ84DRAFT_376686 [Glonium stellatum]